MSWMTILKINANPRTFLTEIQNVFGGEIKGQIGKGGKTWFMLSTDKGYVKIRGKRNTPFYVSVNGAVIGEDYDLDKLKETALRELGGE
jgi:hypothetical protein